MIDDEYKYKRTQYRDLGRKCDRLLAAFLSNLPAPASMLGHWKRGDQSSFEDRYSVSGELLWVSSVSSHLLLFRGSYVLRIWTDVAKHCYVDISEQLVASLSSGTLLIERIPSGCAKKSSPMTHRIRVFSEEQVTEIVASVKRVYGLESTRVPLRVWKWVGRHSSGR